MNDLLARFFDGLFRGAPQERTRLRRQDADANIGAAADGPKGERRGWRESIQFLRHIETRKAGFQILPSAAPE